MALFHRRALAPLVAAVAALIVAPGGATSGPLWLIFVDDLHLSFTETGKLRDTLKLIAKELIQEGDVFAVRSSGSSGLMVDVTSDRARLESSVKTAVGNGLKPIDAQPSRRDQPEVRYRAGLAFATAEQLIASTDHVSDRRKALIYISNGYIDMLPQSDRQPDLAHIAGTSGVTIFTIDPRLFSHPPQRDPRMDPGVWELYWTTTRESLRVLAELTGGFAQGDADLRGTIRRINSAMR